jgi:hypothetical protein
MYSKSETVKIKSMLEKLGQNERSKVGFQIFLEKVSKLESQYCEIAVKVWSQTGSKKLSKFGAKKSV